LTGNLSTPLVHCPLRCPSTAALYVKGGDAISKLEHERYIELNHTTRGYSKMNKLEFSTDDLVINEDGKVEINNPAFAKSLIDHIKKVDPGTVALFDNCNCSKGKALSRVALKGAMPAAALKIDPGTVGLFDNCNCSH
jgi:hypothetical protein